jgi:RNA polymerase sigma-70 factor (ECF subfamily)
MNDLKWLIAREIPYLRRYALALLRDSHAADDLVQDCLERALRKRHLWQQSGSLKGWLFRILYTVFLNTRKTQRRDKQILPLDAIEFTLAASPNQEAYVECREMAKALAQLPEQQYAAIILIALEGFSYDEAAWIQGIPIGTLRSRLYRGREALRTMGAETWHHGKVRRIK